MISRETKLHLAQSLKRERSLPFPHSGTSGASSIWGAGFLSHSHISNPFSLIIGLVYATPVHRLYTAEQVNGCLMQSPFKTLFDATGVPILSILAIAPFSEFVTWVILCNQGSHTWIGCHHNTISPVRFGSRMTSVRGNWVNCKWGRKSTNMSTHVSVQWISHVY